MSTQEIDGARSVFDDFAAKMNAWEVKSFALSKPENGGLEQNLAKIKQELVAIYDQFLTPKERKTGRLAGPDVGFPPEYDPANEKFVAAENLGAGKFLLETSWTHPVINFSEKRRYTLIFKNGEWRLDKKETFSPAKGKWGNHPF